MRFLSVVAIAALFAAPQLVLAQKGQKIQCWTNSKGQRECGDRIPPEYADKERQIIQDGRVIDTKRSAKTEAEYAEEERRANEAAEAAKRAEYDRSLVEMYRSTKDIEAMRDERIAFVDGRLVAARKGVADNEKAVTDLRARADAQMKEKNKVDERLAKQLKQYEKSLLDNQQSVARMEKEREEIASKFNSDLARFNELRGTKPAAAPAAPAAASSGG